MVRPMDTLEALDHLSQIVMAISIIGILWAAIEQRRARILEEKKLHLDPNIPYPEDDNE